MPSSSISSKVGCIGLADEVVEALDGQAVEIEMGGHAAGDSRRPRRRSTSWPSLQGVMRGREPHGPGADDDSLAMRVAPLRNPGRCCA